jgi:cell division protein FtsB
MKTKLINENVMSRILLELDGWQGKLTWPLVGKMVAQIIGVPSISRHTLLSYPQLVQAVRARKAELKSAEATKSADRVDYTLDAALFEVEKLKAQVARLERERELYVEQFARWQHNLYMMPNVDMVALNKHLNRPLPKSNRAKR